MWTDETSQPMIVNDNDNLVIERFWEFDTQPSVNDCNHWLEILKTVIIIEITTYQVEQKVCRETVKKVGDNISKSFQANISCLSIELIPMLLLEGVQAGGKEEEGEGSERGSHLRVQDRAQDGVRRSEGEEVESACWSR